MELIAQMNPAIKADQTRDYHFISKIKSFEAGDFRHQNQRKYTQEYRVHISLLLMNVLYGFIEVFVTPYDRSFGEPILD